jgi:hypothetical protein
MTRMRSDLKLVGGAVLSRAALAAYYSVVPEWYARTAWLILLGTAGH